MTRRIPTAFEAPPREFRHAVALKAVAIGEANPEQQKLALDWIIYLAAEVNGLSYRPGVDGSRETAFAEGRRFVGLEIRSILALNGDELERLRKNDG